MKHVRFALALLLVFAITKQGYAQSISWATGYPQAGTVAKSIAVSGTITLINGWVQGDVTIEIWGVAKTSTMLQTKFTITKANLVANKNGTYSFGPVNVPVTVGSANYNVIAKEAFTNGMGTALGTGVTQPVTAMSSAP